jgi:hypothetical protein
MIFFSIFILTISENSYKIYATYFQNGMLYVGETKAKFFMNFLEVSFSTIGIIILICMFFYKYRNNKI